MTVSVLLIGLAASVALIVAMLSWRLSDKYAEQKACRTLLLAGTGEIATFYPALVEGLPEPAQRYFRYTIAPGATLKTAIQIEMSGEIGLGSKAEPAYKPMRAHQILAPPFGLVWQLKAGPISGSDGALPGRSWTRFWAFNVIPVVRAGGIDHRRSAFGRVAAEAAFWVPASLLPGKHVRWESLSKQSARAVLSYGHFTQAVDITVDSRGAPTQVVLQRWSNENPDRVFQEQPFGGVLSDFQKFEGYTLPTRVEGGNWFGTPDYFPFFKAKVSKVTFAGTGGEN